MHNYIFKFHLLATAIVMLFSVNKIYAGQLDMNFTGISYHIGADDSNPAYVNAPRKLDKNAAFVFNPGLALSYDFRQDSRDAFWHGFSPIAMAFYIRDCNDIGLYGIGAGIKYRFMFTDNFSGDLNLIGMLGAGKEWRSDQTNILFMPYPNIGVNYHFKNNVVTGLTMAFVPENSAISATDGFNLLFFTLYLSIPLQTK